MPLNFIGPNDLVSARTDQLKLMPDLADLFEPARAEDQQGGFTETYVLTYAAVQCRLGELSGAEALVASRMDVVADYVLTLPYDQEVTEDMRIQHEGQDYTIAMVNAQRSHDTARRCLVRRLQ
tara:strand:+ start:480 stop:848 length:369 start_codon:yes stop_codon:yes gene_type:complete